MSRLHFDSKLRGCHWIAGEPSQEGPADFFAINAETGERLPCDFAEATHAEIDTACRAAEDAFWEFSSETAERRAALLDAIADQVMEAGDILLERCQEETGLPRARLEGERMRTVKQARLFANVVRDGSWAQPRIDHRTVNRPGSPAPDCRSVWMPVGPVAVFGASNFPLAISVVGNDTIAALAAGCTVVVKAHPAHPGTCEILAQAFQRAIKSCGMSPGIFSLLHGRSYQVGTSLVQHPAIQTVGFTGSLAGGRALYDAVGHREQLIPVFAEMGSVNPVFLLPSAINDEKNRSLSSQLVASVTAASGQMCTQPGLLLGIKSAAWQQLVAEVGDRVAQRSPYTLLHQGITNSYKRSVQHRAEILHPVSTVAGSAEGSVEGGGSQVEGIVFQADIQSLLDNASLQEEIFGPTSVFVECHSVDQMVQFALGMKGSLTASIFGDEEDLKKAAKLLQVLKQKVGRIVFNGLPTGVEVNHAMMHGGPYPAAIGAFTSIGTGSVQRFARPVCLQNCPEDILPADLQSASRNGVVRLIDGRYDIGIE